MAGLDFGDERRSWPRLVRGVLAAAAALVAGYLAWSSRLTAAGGSVVALVLAVATLTAVIERDARLRRAELERLARMARRLDEADDPASVGNVLLDAVGETFGFRRMVLFEVAGGSPHLLTCRNLEDARVADFVPDTGSVLATGYDERRTMLVHDLDPGTDPWLAAILPNARDVVVVPLVVNVPLVADAVNGVLVAESGPGRRRLGRRAVRTVDRFAGHAATALRRANHVERLRQSAATDALTQLANRRSFDESLDRELSRAQRTDGRLSVVLLDIDHFKRLNDTHGHVVGDRVLRRVAQALRECGREYDTIARYGGEEFAAVLPGCSPSVAVQVAERLCRAVRETATDVPVTASAGAATYPYDGIDAAGLLTAADQALYAAKHAGRDQVRSAAAVVPSL